MKLQANIVPMIPLLGRMKTEKLKWQKKLTWEGSPRYSQMPSFRIGVSAFANTSRVDSKSLKFWFGGRILKELMKVCMELEDKSGCFQTVFDADYFW